MNDQQLTDLDLDEIAARAAEHRAALSGWLNCYSPLPEQEALEGVEGVLKEDVPALLAEVRRLRAELAAETRLHSGTIDDRDRAQDMADKLAYAVAPEEVIGEHSSMNCPWENALDLITPMAEVDKLRQQVAAVADLCDAAEKQATRWEQPLPVPEWVTAVRRAVEQPAASEEQR